MQVAVVTNLDVSFDAERLVEAISLRYERDRRPYEISVLGDLKHTRIQVRVDSHGPTGEFSMDVAPSMVGSTDQLIHEVHDRIDWMLDSIEACADASATH